MNIAFDIDGVLTDIETFQLHYGAQFFSKRHNLPVKDRNGYGIRQIYDCSKKMERQFWKKYFLKYLLSEAPRPDAVDTIQKLHKAGHNIFIITSRALTSRNNPLGWLARSLTRRWFRKWKIPYHEIVFCSVEHSPIDKTNACAERKVDVIVEDTAENIAKLSTVTKVLCFHTLNNQDCEGPNITRLYSFKEVYQQINRLLASK